MFTKEQLIRSLLRDGFDGSCLQSGDFKALNAWFKRNPRNAYDQDDRTKLVATILRARKHKPTPTKTRNGDWVSIGRPYDPKAVGYFQGIELSAGQLRSLMLVPRSLMRCRLPSEVLADFGGDR